MTRHGFIGLIAIVISLSACQEQEASSIYKSWKLVDATMDDDQAQVDQMIDAGIVYSFNEDGTFTYTSLGETYTGTFELNDDETELNAVLEGIPSSYLIELSENSLKLTSGSQSMTFVVAD